MAGEIKSTLTLDVSKFASAIDRAIGGAESLEKHLKSAAKVAADFDKGITGVGNDLAGFAKNFRLLDQSVEQMVNKLAGVITRFDQLGQHSATAATGVDKLGSAVKKTTSLNADQWVKKYATELDKLAPALKSAVSSIIDFDRANIASANIAEKTADKTAQAKLKTLAAEREANKKIIADRERMAAELLSIEEQMQRRADSNATMANRYKGGNINHPTAVMYRGESATAQNAANTAAAERAALEAVIKEMKWQNAEIEKQIALEKQAIAVAGDKAKADKAAAEATTAAKKAEREAAAAAKEAATESARFARQAANERMRAAREAAEFERVQAASLAQMWKGMGQMWGASKIEGGLKAGLGKASEYQQGEMRVKLMNLPTDEFEEFKAKAFDISKEEKYISVIDTMQARLDALTAIGYNNKGTIDATMQSALRNSQLLMSAGYEGGNRSDLIKNLYGFAESRQVMGDPAKVKESFDIARRMAIVSGGKLNIADMETVARNMGDLRQSMNMEGWLGVASLMEQFKVAGSQGHGGAGAGVSSVGTMLKMMSLYAAGKPVTNKAAEQLLGADILNSGFTNGDVENFQDAKHQNAAFGKMVKTAGFKNAQEMQADPVSFFSGLRGQVIDYTKDKKNRDKFYDGEDDSSKEAESAALKKFFAKMGMSNKTVDGLLLMMDKGFIERSGHVKESAKKLEDEDKAIEKMRETWKNAVDEMNAGAANLAVAFTPLLAPLSEIPKAIGGILNKAAEFVKENPLAGFADLAMVAFGGLSLAVKGALNTFGMAGGVINAFRTMLGGGAVAAESAGAAFGGLRATVMALGIAFPKLTGVMDTVITVATRVGGALLAPFATVAGGAAGAIGWIGKLSTTLLGFIARWASPIGWAALAGQFGWVIGEWVSSLKVGGISIGEHMQNIFLDIELGWKRMLLGIQEKWVDFKKLIGGDDFLGESAERKEIEAERARLSQYEKDMRITPTEPPKVAAPAGDKKEGKKEGDKPKTKVTDTSDLFAKEPRHVREFENSFQRSLEQMVGRQSIDGLKLGTILSGQASYEEQAKAAFMEKWLGGDFDDGKDPSKRKFVKDGKAYNKEKGWSADDLDLKGVDKQTGKTVEQWLEAYKASKQLEDAIKGVTFATERAAAKDEEASVAVERMTGVTAGQTEAMKALNREFAREEARNPTVKDNKDYQDRKAKAQRQQAAADYANMAADLVQKNKEMEAQFLNTERERLEASVQATYDAKKKEAQIVIDELDRQIEAAKAAYGEQSDEYLKAIEIRKQGEDEFTRYLKNIQEERTRALETPMQKMLRDWQDFYGNLDKLGDKWAEGFTDQITTLLTTGKADFKAFAQSVMVDLAKIAIKNSIAGFLGGPEGIGGMGLGALLKTGVDKLMGKSAGGLVNGGLKAPAGGLGGADAAIPGMEDAAGTGLKAGAGIDLKTPGAGSAIDEQAAKLGKSFDSVAGSAEAAGLAQEGMTTAVEAGTAVEEMATSATEADTIATELGTAATETNTIIEEVATAVTEAGSVVEETTEVPADLAAGEAAMAFASEAAAAMMMIQASMLANGGVADSFGLSYFANGGAFTNGIYSSPTLFKFANGGQFGVMGEAGPEAVMPLSRDGKGRLGVNVNNVQEGGAGAASPVVNIAITVNKDGGGFSNQSGDDANQWRQMADRVKGIVIQEISTQQRPGGLLYK